MIVAGFGFRAEAGQDSLRAALEMACGGLSPDALAHPEALATAAGKEQNAGLHALAVQMGLPIHAIAAQDLSKQETVTQSNAAQAAYDTGSVAEAAALAAAGPNARLIAPRQISPDRMATCAIAQGDET